MATRPSAIAVVLVMLLGACGPGSVQTPTGGQGAAGSPSSATSPTIPATQGLPAYLSGSEAVTFTTDDGIAIEGRVFGNGDVGVVLAHGTFDSGQGSWFTYASVLALQGYRVLTFDLRGFCPGALNGCSGGSKDPPNTWHDVVAGAAYLRSLGIQRVFLLGASLGARSSLWAAAQPGVTVAGVIAVSTPIAAVPPNSPAYDFTPAIIGAIDEPKLFMAGSSDEDYAAQAETLFGWSTEPKQLAVVPSAAHGPALLEFQEAAATVLDFLSRHR